MYQRIMVPMDGSKLAECVLPQLEILLKESVSPEILLVRAVEPVLPYVMTGEPTAMLPLKQTQAMEMQGRQDAEEYLNRVATRLIVSGINTRTRVLPGKAPESLIDFAVANKVDMVIISSHGRSGLGRLVWGNVADQLLRSLSVPVMLVPASVKTPA